MRRVIFFIVTYFTPLAAALPPLAQSSREIQALLSDGRTQESLGSGEVIQQVIRKEGGYLVITQNFLMRVDVEYLPRAFAGPVPFELHFYPPVNLSPNS